jgi:hypothetical protein
MQKAVGEVVVWLEWVVGVVEEAELRRTSWARRVGVAAR